MREAPAWDEEPDAQAEPVDPELLARRRRFRAWVTRGMVGLLFFTVIALLIRGAGQWVAEPDSPASATASHPIVKAPDPIPAAPHVASPQPSLPLVAATPAEPPARLESLRDVELPPVADEVALARWSSLARGASAEELDDVDARLAKLVKASTPSIRDRSRLARAILWRERGRGAEVQAVFDDLALHAKSRDVRAAARSNQTPQPR